MFVLIYRFKYFDKLLRQMIVIIIILIENLKMYKQVIFKFVFLKTKYIIILASKTNYQKS